MKKIVFRFGLYSAITIIALFSLKFMILGLDGNWTAQEIAGYASMVIALLFVFFGIKQYRDRINHGTLTFGKGLKVGILIALIASTAFGLFDIIYIYFINPEFFDKYFGFQMTQMQQRLPPAEFETWKKQMESMREVIQNPVVNFFLMFATVLIIGLIITVVSSLILMRKPRPVVQ
jgi:hypothetical protein